MQYYCPCHGGKYDNYGFNIGGLPPRPLDARCGCLHCGLSLKKRINRKGFNFNIKRQE
nr:hypothetical protein [Bacillus sp. FJAT-27445]